MVSEIHVYMTLDFRISTKWQNMKSTTQCHGHALIVIINAFTSLQNEKTDINLCKANNSTIGKRSKICSKLTSYFTSYSSVPIVDFEPTKNLSDIHIHALIRR